MTSHSLHSGSSSFHTFLSRALSIFGGWIYLSFLHCDSLSRIVLDRALGSRTYTHSWNLLAFSSSEASISSIAVPIFLLAFFSLTSFSQLKPSNQTNNFSIFPCSNSRNLHTADQGVVLCVRTSAHPFLIVIYRLSILDSFPTLCPCHRGHYQQSHILNLCSQLRTVVLYILPIHLHNLFQLVDFSPFHWPNDEKLHYSIDEITTSYWTISSWLAATSSD